MGKRVSEILRIGDGRDWHFFNEKWIDGENGLLTIPEDKFLADGIGMRAHHYAFYLGSFFKDVRVRFEFRSASRCDVGIIFRARGESRFYVFYIPNCGMASRSQNFWASFAKMDESGYFKAIKTELVRRVPGNWGVWQSVDLVLRGNRITANIGAHGFFEARDTEETYPAAGAVGLFYYGEGVYGYPEVRNVTVEAEAFPSELPFARNGVPTNWYYPRPEKKNVTQKPFDLNRFPDGEIVLSYSTKEKDLDTQPRPMLIRSFDSGRTWSPPEERPDWQGDIQHCWRVALHLTPKNRFVSLIPSENGYSLAESKDRGRSWSNPIPIRVYPPPPLLSMTHQGPQALLNLADGSMLLFGRGETLALKHPNPSHMVWGARHYQAFSCRTTDDGQSWSSWVNMDNSGRPFDYNKSPDRPFDETIDGSVDGNHDLTEVCAAQIGDGRILALIRPMYSPWMWETWSENGGTNWAPCAHGPFPGYATPNMLRTRSGAVVVAHRVPSTTIHVSRDDGHTWDEGTQIDSSTGVMGVMAEVEPDVILYVYWDSIGYFSQNLMRAQLIRITPAGLEPERAN